MRGIEDLTGKTFGHWLVTCLHGADRGGSIWSCVCACGTARTIHRGNLVSGKTKSCGCEKPSLIAAAKTTHGMFGTREYRTWSGMITRCYNKNAKSFADYGARGIVVCDSWRQFENFLTDMGARPAGMTIDRKDVNGHYEPGNCRWADAKTQSRNRRTTKATPAIVEAARSFSISSTEFMERTRCGLSSYRAIMRGDSWL